MFRLSSIHPLLIKHAGKFDYIVICNDAGLQQQVKYLYLNFKFKRYRLISFFIFEVQ